MEVIYKERIRNGTMKQKNVYIQVMRFLFSLCIVLFHMRGIKELDEKYYLTGETVRKPLRGDNRILNVGLSPKQS